MSTSESSSQDGGSDRVGITLVTGFLGSGKSTLIRRVLTENHNLRIVVVENEFGDTAEIEQAIVTQGVGASALEEFIELPNGCICCAAQDDLVDALARLVEQKRGRFDHILVEASGLADPRPVAAAFWVDEGIDASLRLDAVVAVVDSVGIKRCLEGHGAVDQSIALKQLAVADVVLLNKMDLLAGDGSSPDQENSDTLCDILRSNGCVARILPTTKCNIDLTDMLNIRAYEDGANVNALNAGPPEKFQQHAHGEERPASTFTLTFTGRTFSAQLLTRALGHLLWDEDESEGSEGKGKKPRQEIWRMKALVIVENEKYKWIYQSVHTLFDDMVSSVSVQDDGEKLSRFLFIGQNMEREYVQHRLEEAIVGNQDASCGANDCDGQ